MLSIPARSLQRQRLCTVASSRDREDAGLPPFLDWYLQQRRLSVSPCQGNKLCTPGAGSALQVSAKASVCSQFLRGFCPLGAQCPKKHILTCQVNSWDSQLFERCHLICCCCCRLLFRASVDKAISASSITAKPGSERWLLLPVLVRRRRRV